MAEEIKIMLAIGIMFLMILSFAVQWIPASATALLAAISMVFCRFLSPAELAASFGADAVIMVAGIMIVGNAVFETGLAERIGCAVLNLKFVRKFSLPDDPVIHGGRYVCRQMLEACVIYTRFVPWRNGSYCRK